jgi:hypothetical protein
MTMNSQNPLVLVGGYQEVVAVEKSKGVDEDFEASRRNLIQVMEVTKGAIQHLSTIAFQSQMSDAYDVLTKLIKEFASQQSQLLQMYRMRETKEAAKPAPGAVQGEVVDNRTQNVFVGTPADLANVLENMKNKETK